MMIETVGKQPPNECLEVSAELLGAGSQKIGAITLNRPQAINALNLPMVRALASKLKSWAVNPAVLAVVVRGSAKEPTSDHFGHFCAGGDIRFFHSAALSASSALDDFFAEEYALNHLIHTYPKPYVALMDGVVMGGGMGISQGASLRVVTERTKMAMPETLIGLFPDVGGGYFLSRCGPKRHASGAFLGEYLALTGETLGPEAAIAAGLADAQLPAACLAGLWQEIGSTEWKNSEQLVRHVTTKNVAKKDREYWTNGQFEQIKAVFCLPTVVEMLHALEAGGSSKSKGDIKSDRPDQSHDSAPPTTDPTDPDSNWHPNTARLLRTRSPLMLCVTLEHIRRARSMSLADDLRMELNMVHRCFHLRPSVKSETVEGIRALAVDKDHAPKWQPGRVEEVDPLEVGMFFQSPWVPTEHPLRGL